MRSRVLYLATCLFSLSFLFGCAADSVEIIDAPAQKTLPIVNGSVYAGDPAVGIITAGGSLCTATLVGQRTVLTAGHCIQQGRQHVFIAGNEYWPAVRTIVHPGYKPPSTDNDVALAILRDAPPITPAFISTRPPQVGQQLKLIGFGQTSIGLRRAPRLTGPFDAPTAIARPDESARDGVLVYAAKAHASLVTPDGAVLITYATNHRDFATLVADQSLYYPRFFALHAR